MKLQKMIIELDRSDITNLLDVFESYIISQSSIEGDYLAEFIKKLVSELTSDSMARSFIEKQSIRRKEPIEWFFKETNDEGEDQIKLPSTQEEMKKMLQAYDMNWLGNA